jgi:hypothetical protein
MPDPVSIKRQQALSIRSALENLHGGDLEPYRAARLRLSPEVSVAEAVEVVSARLIKHESIANKLLIRAAKLEKANEELSKKVDALEKPKKPRARKFMR